MSDDTTDKTIVLSSIVGKPHRRKSPVKRVITKESRWQKNVTGNDCELVKSMLNMGSDEKGTTVQRLAWSQIQQKLYNYREQDVAKQDKATAQNVDGLDSTTADYVSYHIPNMTPMDVLQLLDACQLQCYYCQQTVSVLYEWRRQTNQWTLERVDNKRGHFKDNVVISCLACNLKRRVVHFDKFSFSKHVRWQKEAAP